MRMGERIRNERIRQGRTLRDVADCVGVSTVYVMDIERGNRIPATDVVDRICAELGMPSEDYLLEVLNAKMPTGYRVVKEGVS